MNADQLARRAYDATLELPQPARSDCFLEAIYHRLTSIEETIYSLFGDDTRHDMSIQAIRTSVELIEARVKPPPRGTGY